MHKYRRIPPYHGSTIEMKNKNLSRRLIVIGGEVDDRGKFVTKEARAKALVLFRETNSRSYSWRTIIYLAVQT